MAPESIKRRRNCNTTAVRLRFALTITREHTGGRGVENGLLDSPQDGIGRLRVVDGSGDPLAQTPILQPGPEVKADDLPLGGEHEQLAGGGENALLPVVPHIDNDWHKLLPDYGP